MNTKLKNGLLFWFIFGLLLAVLYHVNKLLPEDPAWGAVRVFSSPNRAKAEWVSWGHSHSFFDLDFSSTGVPYFHYGKGSEDLLETRLLLDERLVACPATKVVFRPISYFDFYYDNRINSPSSRVMAYIASDRLKWISGDLTNFLKGKSIKFFSKFGFLRSCHLNPFISKGAAGRDELGYKKSDRSFSGEIDMREVENLNRTTPSAQLQSALVETITHLQSKGIRLILYTPPYYSKYLESISLENKRFTQELIKKYEMIYGVEYYDFSHDEEMIYNKKYFSNSDHLNSSGAKFFTQKLLDRAGRIQSLGMQKSKVNE